MNNFLCLSVLDSHVFKVRRSLFAIIIITRVYLLAWVCVTVCVWRCMHEEVRGQHVGASSLHFLHGWTLTPSQREGLQDRTFPWGHFLWLPWDLAHCESSGYGVRSRGEPPFRTRWGDRRWRSHPPPRSVLSFCTAWGGREGRRREDIPEDQLSPGNWWELPLLRSCPFLSSSPVDSLGRIPKAGKWPEKVHLASLSELLMACEEREGAGMEGGCWCWRMMGTQTSSVPLPALWWTRASQLLPPLDTETQCGCLKKCTELPSWVA